MKNNLIIILLFICVSFSIHAQNSSIELKITNIRNSKGYIRYAIFDNEKHFLSTKTGFIDAGSVNAQKGSIKIKTNNIPDGFYAISVFHDENYNEKVDTNIFGIPTEGFGFSNNPTLYFGPPNYKECLIEKKSNTKLNIEIKYYL